MATLQGIDLIAQKLAALANMLAADCPTTALEQVRLEALRHRFFAHQI
jgi:ABC-type dipeptide/oligopeptide/nickel transport system ATPase component